MKPKSTTQFRSLAAVFLGCLAGICSHSSGQTPAGKPEPSDARIDAVFLAQTHVMKPDQPYFKLVGNREALLKAHVVSPSGAAAPEVVAHVITGGEPARPWRFASTVPALETGLQHMLLRAPNPLPNGPLLRFANQTQDRHLAGWLTLGTLHPRPTSSP